MRHCFLLALPAPAASRRPALAQQVGEVGVDWLGNDIIVEAIKDPKVEGVTCHVSYFDRGVDRPAAEGQLVRGPVRFVDLLPPDRTDHDRRHRSRARTARRCSSRASA